MVTNQQQQKQPQQQDLFFPKDDFNKSLDFFILFTIYGI